MVGMAADPQTDQLDERRASPVARAIGGPRERGGDGVGVRAVDRDSRDTVPGGLVGEDPDPRLLGHGRRKRRLVVLEAEHHGQAADRAQIDRLVPLAERRTALADERDRHSRRALKMKGEAHACRRQRADRERRRGGQDPQAMSPMCRSRPFIGGPAFPICALRIMRTVTGSGRIASAAPAS
jgi:hypothetical protein